MLASASSTNFQPSTLLRRSWRGSRQHTRFASGDLAERTRGIAIDGGVNGRQAGNGNVLGKQAILGCMPDVFFRAELEFASASFPAAAMRGTRPTKLMIKNLGEMTGPV